MSNPRHLLLRLATLMLALAAIFAPQNASAKSHQNPETRVRDFSAAPSNITQVKPDLTPDKHYEKLAALRQLVSGPPLVPKGGGRKAASVAPKTGTCFAAGTPVAVAGDRRPIEELRVGDRVRTDNEKPTPTKVAKGWQIIELDMPNPDGSDDTVEIVLLRSPEWIRSLRAKVGGRVELRISEMGLEGPASVRSIVSAPTITEGSGRVVTGTFTHLNSFVYKLTLQGGEVIQGTRQHPIYSEERQAFVRIDELEINELLRTSSGTTRVEAIERLPGDFRVYNIEVEDDHVYFVGDAEVLVHNQCADVVGFRKTHILNRHGHGRGMAGKTEFPSGWGDQRALNAIADVATDPTSLRGLGAWNSPYAVGMRDGVLIRVDFYPLGHSTYAGQISTAYPINVPVNP